MDPQGPTPQHKHNKDDGDDVGDIITTRRKQVRCLALSLQVLVSSLGPWQPELENVPRSNAYDRERIVTAHSAQPDSTEQIT